MPHNIAQGMQTGLIPAATNGYFGMLDQARPLPELRMLNLWGANDFPRQARIGKLRTTPPTKDGVSPARASLTGHPKHWPTDMVGL